MFACPLYGHLKVDLSHSVYTRRLWWIRRHTMAEALAQTQFIFSKPQRVSTLHVYDKSKLEQLVPKEWADAC